ncbi:MAG: DUF2723 domain-containing protein [Patescibacteria group bacterium]|nr:DUF2723 domain-containing protein [Patescibacteria group bacterium]
MLGVPHPPGSPLYILVGRVMSFIPFLDYGLRVNLIAAIVSAFTILLLFLTIVRLIKEWRGEPQSVEDKIILNASAIIGALAFTFSDTFWFNAVEAEVYSAAMFFTALVLYLILLWMDAYKDYHSIRYLVLIFYLMGLSLGIHLESFLVVPTIFLLVWFTDKKIFFRYDLWFLLIIFVIIGYSTYLSIYIRANLNPPINENNPDTWDGMMKYLNREQYGSESMILGIFKRAAPFWEYQLKKMFFRYFTWQYIGRGATIGPDGYIVENLSFNGLYGLPFLLGLIGFYHHLKSDWKRWLAILALFIVTGPLLNIYLNQPEPQPRERDYVYVGCFFAYAIWIGMGVTYLLTYVYKVLADRPGIKNLAAGGVIAFCALIVPANLFQFNFDSHDRMGNYVAWDHSYNILETCEPNAIIFTNGDNDTFPVWYLQQVMGIRKDVRIVNLSLLNTNWYIMQLKYDEPKVPISLPDEQIQEQNLVMWEKARDLSLPVTPDKYRTYMKEVAGQLKFPDTTTNVKFQVAPTLAGRALRVQDWLVLNIIATNNWQRPVYFAITVEGKNFLGLNNYLRMDGMAYKLTPVPGFKIHPPVIRENIVKKYKYRNLNNPNVYYDDNTISLLQNYRNGFIQLAVAYYNSGQRDSAVAVMDSMEAVMPESVIPIPNAQVIEEIGRLYFFSGRPEELRKRLDYLVSLPSVINDKERLYNYAAMYSQLLKDYEKSQDILKKLVAMTPEDGRIVGMLAMNYKAQQKYELALDVLKHGLLLIPMIIRQALKLKNWRQN